jgi:hypothetical protein
MAKFPEIDALIVTDPVSETLVFTTLRSQFGPGPTPQRKAMQLYPTRAFAIGVERVILSQARTLYNFYLARKGSFEVFNFFHPLIAAYAGEYVGTGTGSQTVWNLPSKSGATCTVYIDGIAQTGGGVNYTFVSGTGEDGADKVTFAAAPTAGQRITYDFTGKLKVRCTFAEDKLTFETFLARLVSARLTLQGELNA